MREPGKVLEPSKVVIRVQSVLPLVVKLKVPPELSSVHAWDNNLIYFDNMMFDLQQKQTCTCMVVIHPKTFHQSASFLVPEPSTLSTVYRKV